MSHAVAEIIPPPAAPDAGPTSFHPVERQVYRDGMARLAAAVNIITSTGEDGWCGFTASAVSSVTDSPPTLLVCVNRTVQAHKAISTSGVLCVNTVAGPQEGLAMTFAGAGGNKDMKQRFAGGSWTELVTGAPVLAGSIVSFDCRVTNVSTIGTHDVFFCEVLAVCGGEGATGGEALVYFDRKFHAVS
ncbi:FMN reductase (NADH) RutF [Aureimonas sp. SA4125]|uniref:flavin reductase n=1 Tax=Aureimonas sp. SA4125 TaxID=2826993 RepID=UPI001CC7F2DE|nr:flavin reductase [Aureimonas sp. SA4125]BDA82732.1 FMN reductase (NADH) RutF [Aureimonas sp. SA4125]